MGFFGSQRQYNAYRGTVGISIHNFREITSAGVVANTVGGGGLLSSDTTPAMAAATTTEGNFINWIAAGADPIQTSIALPEDFDGRDEVYLDLFVRTDNTGGGSIEAASFTVNTSWDNGTQVVDTATDTVPATTSHVVTAVIAASDIPDTAGYVNIQLVPGTHANDPIHLFAARLRYTKKTV